MEPIKGIPKIDIDEISNVVTSIPNTIGEIAGDVMDFTEDIIFNNSSQYENSFDVNDESVKIATATPNDKDYQYEIITVTKDGKTVGFSLPPEAFITILDIEKVEYGDEGFRVVTKNNEKYDFSFSDENVNFYESKTTVDISSGCQINSSYHGESQKIEISDYNTVNLTLTLPSDVDIDVDNLSKIEYTDNKITVYTTDGNSQTFNRNDDTAGIIDNSIHNVYKSNYLYNMTTASHGSYGGNQGSFYDNNFSLLNNVDILSVFNKYFPDLSAENNLEDYSLCLSKVSKVGCGYVAAVNSIFMYYDGKEEEFKEKFGFDMFVKNSDGSQTLNYEPLVLDYFLWSSKNFDNFNSIEEVYGNIREELASGDEKFEGTGADGMYAKKIEYFSKYLEEHGVSAEVERKDSWNEAQKNINEIEFKNMLNNGLDNNTTIMISVEGADIYSGQEIKPENLFMENMGSHAMVVTGVDANGNYIVSSWGGQYVLDLSKIEGKPSFDIIKYN